MGDVGYPGWGMWGTQAQAGFREPDSSWSGCGPTSVDGPKGAGFGSDISRRGYVGGAMSEDPAPLRLDFEVNGVGTDWLRAWGRVDPGLSSLGPLT